MSRAVAMIVTLSILTLGLAACGKRGALETPSAAGPIREEKSASVEPKPAEKPHRPFVLDGLLR